MESELSVDPALSVRISQLGGEINDTSTLNALLLSTTFSRYLYPNSWEGWGLEEYATDVRNRFTDRSDQIAEISAFVRTKHDITCGQHFWQPTLFTPFTKGTEDHEEWQSFADTTDLSEIREICGDGQLEFVNIVHSYGYPDRYYVCLQDPVPHNPTVFGTDREVFFQELSNRSSLLDFFKQYCDEKEMLDLLHEIFGVTFLNAEKQPTPAITVA